MVKKTKLLGTSMEKLGIKTSAERLLDPEKAMETAASLQMIGGNIGALGNPFQLLHMGQKDMKKLTDEVLNMAKATFTFDKETGAFTQTTEDMYALRAQAEALGINYEETANAGKELAKVDFIKSSTKLAEKITDEDTQNLVAGLAQISKDGSINIDLPGLDKNFASLDEALGDKDFNDALIEYQKNAGKSDKELALDQMSISEKQLATENEIKNLLLFSMAPGKREKFLQEQKAMNEDLTKKSLEIAKPLAEGSSKLMSGFNTASKTGVDLTVDAFDKMANSIKLEDRQNDVNKKLSTVSDLSFLDKTSNSDMPVIGNNQQNNTPTIDNNQQVDVVEYDTKGMPIIKGGDMVFPSGDEPTILSKGQIYEGIKEDSVYVGTDFEKIFERGKAATNVLSEMMSKGGGGTTNNQVSGKVDFGEIRVKIDAPGVDTSALDNALNSKQFANQIMAMIANQKSFYTNQATLEG